MSITIPNLDEAVAASSFSGLATVHHGTDLEFSRAEGMAHRALGVPNTADTRFAIASGAKAFTGLAAMRLVERGILDLDQPVRGHLAADLPLIDAAVTLRHLLTHTSGIGDYLDESGAWDQADYVIPVPVNSQPQVGRDGDGVRHHLRGRMAGSARTLGLVRHTRVATHGVGRELRSPTARRCLPPAFLLAEGPWRPSASPSILNRLSRCRTRQAPSSPPLLCAEMLVPRRPRSGL